jgi:hypothetical protein
VRCFFHIVGDNERYDDEVGQHWPGIEAPTLLFVSGEARGPRLSRVNSRRTPAGPGFRFWSSMNTEMRLCGDGSTNEPIR